MLSPKTKYNLRDAKQYFEDHLAADDYYSENESVSGRWLGRGAEMLRLTGTVGRDEFLRLCDNLHPQTGQRLTARLKTTRSVVTETGHAYEAANRRIFYDFTISPPKSVSVAALIGGDAQIVEAHHRAVETAVASLERFAATRVHVGNSITDRVTGNMVCAVFRHDTSRALDPHLHSHCVVFNATHDPVENRWKALQNHHMLRARKYVESVYYHELSRDLHRLGYTVIDKPRGDFEIEGVTTEICDRFSKRHRQIDDQTRDLLQQHPNLTQGNLAAVRENIAQKHRARKRKDMTPSMLDALWTNQLSPGEKAGIATLKGDSTQPPTSVSPETAVRWAEEHLFDRLSVVPEHDIWRQALDHARGQNISLADIQQVTQQRDYIRGKHGAWEITTREALLREWEIVCMAKDGIGRFRSLGAGYDLSRNTVLAPDQRLAVDRILRSRDFVTLFRGGAGTGKSFALQQVRTALLATGQPLHVIAPQRQQVIDLERDGMTGAQTVSEFLTKQPLPKQAVVIVDEAGQIGAKQMHQLFRYVADHEGRIILSGDTRQHGAVEASDALRAIEQYAGIKPAELTEIRRQDPARARSDVEREQIQQYRQAVKDASEGNLDASFVRLDRQGAIVVCSPDDQQVQLAQHYLDLTANNHSVVVVSQTWSEIHKVNDHVRSALKSRGLIGGTDTTVTSLEPVDLTDAQKRDRRFYTPDSVIVLNRDAGGFKRGQIARLVAITSLGVVLESANAIRQIPFRFLNKLTVCRTRELPLAAGDRLQLKANGLTRTGQRLANGELVTVDQVCRDGRIKLRDGRVLEAHHRQFVRGFAITSYASQGKTVDYVLFSDSTIKPATNKQQWYVTISRGRKGIKIFTTDKAQLRDNVVRSGDRPLALDLADRRFLRRLGVPAHVFRHRPFSRVVAYSFRQRMLDTFHMLRRRAQRETVSLQGNTHEIRAG